jgi:stage V sporulation protein G
MEITDIRIRKLKTEGKMRAVVSVTFDDCFVVHDIKVIDGEKGLFVAMPSRRIGEGRYRDIAHPINTETRNWIEAEVFSVYEQALAEQEEADESEEVKTEEKLYEKEATL